MFHNFNTTNNYCTKYERQREGFKTWTVFKKWM